MRYLVFAVLSSFLLLVILSVTGTSASCSKTTVKIRVETKNGKKVTVIDQPCCKGYKRTRNRCVPVCSQPCENAKCTAPETCTCNVGFEQLSQFRCVPHCEDCDNGICTKPGYCQCHSGFSRASNGTCLPDCDDCANGFCTLPNVCQCYEGYALSGGACRPVCASGCLNGQCVAPDECLCEAGYTEDGGRCVPLVSSTTPPSCPDGYELDDARECQPICDEPCRNGTCVRPNECECFPGFSVENSTSPFECRPVCAGGCAHGDCLAPGRCVCHAQYGKIGDECIPLCERCSLGQCVRPNECVCDRGYRLIEGDCEPICETECQNAICTGPNACTCLPGYNYTDINALFDCLPVCDEECINGQCVAPQTCQCDEGYVQDEDVPHKCLHPHELCRLRCINGQCHGAECHCDPGYVKNPTDGLCEKTCPHGCTNGDCKAGECFCHDGYRLSSENSSLCEPICGEDYDYGSSGCINGHCVRPNVCKCDDGFEFVDAAQTRCESSEELARQRAAQDRADECRRSCRNGRCRADAVCQCDEGYAHPNGNTFTCDPFCSEPCQNATCVLPDRCECFEGFAFVEGSLSRCRLALELAQEANDHCERLCQNGSCFEAQCHCLLGYRATPEDPFNCLPVCTRPCINGTCAGNDRCRCAQGFRLSTTDNHLCEPICFPACQNGDCIEPNRCACHPGFIPTEDDGSNGCEREPTPEERATRLRQLACERECRNGWCEEGVCKCVEGFAHENGNTLRCEPFCKAPCEAGQCVGNDTCECFERFVPVSQFVCAPVCTEDCVNGFCAEPDVCQCHDGYLRSSENGKCEPDCGVDGCINGECVGPNECICLNGYAPDEEDPSVCHLVPKVILQPSEHSASSSSSSSEYYKISYIHYFIPVIAAVALIVAVLVGKMIVRNRQKDYHVGKLGNVARRGKGRARGGDKKRQRTTDYNDYNLVVLYPTESKENCVYFMPNPDSKTDELTKLHLEIETI